MSERHHENQPSGERVKESLRLIGIPVLHQQPRAYDTKAIGKHRDGDRAIARITRIAVRGSIR